MISNGASNPKKEIYDVNLKALTMQDYAYMAND